MVNYHLVVLVHGLWGNSSHLEYIESQIKQNITPSDPNEQIVVYKTGSHSGFLTYDGIDVNGKRISDEILHETARLNEGEEDTITKFSIVGYSLGGLISRYALGVLYSQKYFESIKPINFVTFCSPHVGVLNPGNGISCKIFNNFTPYFLAHSGTQLFLKDSKSISFNNNENSNHLPLLVWMADPNSVFFKALLGFKYHSLYANIINDKRTCWYTSAIDNRDPFLSMVNQDPSVYQVGYIEGYDPVVIDLEKPISFKDSTKEKTHEYVINPDETRIGNFLHRKFNWVKVLGNLVIFTPLWAISFIGSSIFQRFKLNRRVNEFFRDGRNSLRNLYEYISDDATSVALDIHMPSEESVTTPIKDEPENEYDNDNDNELYLETLGRDIKNTVGDQTDNFVESIFDAMNNEAYNHYANKYEPTIPQLDPLLRSENSKKSDNADPFRLDLHDYQEYIVDKLNSLKWNKYPVLITHSKASHAAAIVRYADPSFDEGKVVVDHFVHHVFKAD